MAERAPHRLRFASAAAAIGRGAPFGPPGSHGRAAAGPIRRRAPSRLPGNGGQAAVELLAALPALLLAALIGFQLLAVGWALSLADGAAEAGALAAGAGADPRAAAREALPGWARERVRVSARGGRVSVELRPPSPLPVLAERLEVSSSAWARPAAPVAAGALPPASSATPPASSATPPASRVAPPASRVAPPASSPPARRSGGRVP